MRNESEERERNPSERGGEEEEEEEEEDEEEEKDAFVKPALCDRLGAREIYTMRAGYYFGRRTFILIFNILWTYIHFPKQDFFLFFMLRAEI